VSDLRWTPRPLPLRYPDFTPQCSTSCPWLGHNPIGCTHPKGAREDDTCHPAVILDALESEGRKRARDSWREKLSACVKLAAEAIEPCPECATLRAENERLTREVDRLTHCHVCGDCLDILDGRCELHANIEDETDYWHQGGERFECDCSWCKANAVLNAKEIDHA
jgi:hypothetical protein